MSCGTGCTGVHEGILSELICFLMLIIYVKITRERHPSQRTGGSIVRLTYQGLSAEA